MGNPQQLLEELAANPGATRDRLRTAGDAADLIAALQAATSDLARQILCDVLGARHERAAVDALVHCLADPSADVRSSAADALAAIRDHRAGPALLERLLLPEPDPAVLRMIVAALGAVQHRAAIPQLLPLIASPDPSMRGTVAWSLGALRAREALPVLRDALRVERVGYPAARLREAVALLEAEPAR
jgi:HEAT repeat protein